MISVVSMFGSSGLFAYDREGRNSGISAWDRSITSSVLELSPIITGEKVILVQDRADSFLLAVDKRTGKDCGEPIVRISSQLLLADPVGNWWKADRRGRVPLRVVGYDVETGKEVWTVRGLSRSSLCMTPVVGEDGSLYVAGWARGGDVDERISIPEWSVATKDWDADKNGTLEQKELPSKRYRVASAQFDRDKTGSITEAEYVWYRDVFETAVNRVIAIRPGRPATSLSRTSRGNTASSCRSASPLAANSYVFLVKNGGIVTSLDGHSGEAIETGRVPGAGNYYASPVTGRQQSLLRR